MTLQEETRERLFWRVFWTLAVLSLTTVALARPHLDQPQPTAASSAARG